MAHLQYKNYEKWGPVAKESYHYSQAVKIGDIIECAGQGGWDPETFDIPDDTAKQIDQAFENCDRNLKNAGGSGLTQVFKVRSYHVPLDDKTMEIVVEAMKKFFPNHQPLWTVLGVPRLGLDTMKVEIEVTAHVA